VIHRASPLIVLATIASLLAPRLSAAAAERVDEYQVKAAFLFNFARFVSWPDSTGPLVIGIAGEDPFGRVLDDTIRGKVVSGRPLQVRRLGDADDISGCHILFVSPSEQRRVRDVIRRAGRGVLTVGEGPEFTRLGGAIHLFRDGSRVRFHINAQAAEASGIKIHSQLMSLAAR
jgi:hypothetical protein